MFFTEKALLFANAITHIWCINSAANWANPSFFHRRIIDDNQTITIDTFGYAQKNNIGVGKLIYVRPDSTDVI